MRHTFTSYPSYQHTPDVQKHWSFCVKNKLVIKLKETRTLAFTGQNYHFQSIVRSLNCISIVRPGSP